MKNKKLFILAASSMLIAVSAFAQNEEVKKDAQEAIAAAAQVINATPRAEVEPPKPKYWTQSLITRVNFDQTSLTNWKAGGLNNTTLNGYIDANAKYAKDKTFWNNRLQLDYGFIYQQGRPFIQKNTDRIYLETKWGRKATEKMNYTANFDFRSQFSDSWNYVIPKSDGEHEPTKKDWMNARSLKSGFLSPANVHLGLGMDWAPNPKTKWLAVNFSPLTGGFTIVANEILRCTNGMKRKQAFSDAALYPYEVKDGSGTVIETRGDYFRAAKFELGASLKVDLNLKVNQNLTYASQLLLFSDYLDNPQNLRVNWDNRINWVLAKHFTLSLSTFLIYDDNVRIVTEDHPAGTRSVQFKELLGFGFTYTFSSVK